MKILHIDSSVLNDHSVSRSLTRQIVDQLRQQQPTATVQYRDLATNPLAHLSAETLAAASLSPSERNEYQDQDIARNLMTLEEFLAADVLVIGAPMYNLSIPSQLKAWIDRIVVAGKTFQYTETGPVGLAKGKQAIIVSTRGGVYSAGPAALLDHQESYLRAVLKFVGVSNVTFVRAEGVAVSGQRESALASAQAQISTLVVAA